MYLRSLVSQYSIIQNNERKCTWYKKVWSSGKESCWKIRYRQSTCRQSIR